MELDLEAREDTEFVRFWNDVLEPKFTKYRHILQGGTLPALGRGPAEVAAGKGNVGSRRRLWLGRHVASTGGARWP